MRVSLLTSAIILRQFCSNRLDEGKKPKIGYRPEIGRLAKTENYFKNLNDYLEIGNAVFLVVPIQNLVSCEQFAL